MQQILFSLVVRRHKWSSARLVYVGCWSEMHALYIRSYNVTSQLLPIYQSAKEGAKNLPIAGMHSPIFF
jgi:hypothetical protein